LVKGIGLRRDSSSVPKQLTVVAHSSLWHRAVHLLAKPSASQTLLFTADDGSHGRERWKSDGTAAGTVMGKDIRPGVGVGSNPQNLTAVGSTLYFTADDGLGGSALWKSDGSTKGTTMVRDFSPLQHADSSHIEQITDVNGTVFFGVVNAYPSGFVGDYDQAELWKTKGTFATTKDFGYSSANTYIDHLTESGGRLYFEARHVIDPDIGSAALFVSNLALTSASEIDYGPDTDLFDLTDVNGTLFYTWTYEPATDAPTACQPD
jgi:ELWxxDGT repeat protein